MLKRPLCFILLCISTSIASAGVAFKPTVNELAFLPEYCKYKTPITGTKKTDEAAMRWKSIFGAKYWGGMHHYCAGLLKLNRRQYESALKELRYMSGAATDFRLWPELQVKTGDAYKGLNDMVSAEQYYYKAYRKFPKYKLSYLKLVDLYLNQGRTKKAKEINDSAIKRFGEKKAFLRRAEKINQLVGKQ